MAIKLTATLAKKVPVEGVQFSSLSYGGALEIEIVTDSPDEIKQRLHNLYNSLSASIDSEIAAAHGAQPPAHNPAPAPIPPASRPAHNGYANTRPPAARPTNSNGNGRKSTATEAQCRAIFAICKNLGIDMAAYLADYNVADASQLPIKTASQIIDDLKSRQNGNGTHVQ